MSTRIAMWSGPRNISTALMRSWESREDTFVCDEPLYAHYLMQTGVDHPVREAVIASQNTDWAEVVSELTGDIPQGKSIYYQKHMAHHFLDNIGRDWLSQVTNAFLIRDPREMLTSLIRVTPGAGLADTGLAQQCEIFDRVRAETGAVAPVIDSRDVLENPRGMLRALCNALDVPFDSAMLSWRAGPRDSDGVWAPHWYAAVEASTRFAPYRPKTDEVPASLTGVHDECRRYYDRLYEHRLSAEE